MELFRKVAILLLLALIGFCTLLVFPAMSAMSNDALEQKVIELEEKIDKAEADASIKKWMEAITISGGIELDYRYIDPKDIMDEKSDTTSEFDIGTIELGMKVKFHEWVTGSFILKGEDLDSDDRIFWDEATIAIQKEGFPLYFIGGKRAQPFGVFNSHLINNPITQDCYEVAKAGVTVGFTPDFLGLDISATVYKGEALADKVSEADYGWTRDPDPNPDPTDDVTSYIFNGSLSPIEGLDISIYYDSEPGQGDRNETAGGAVEYQVGIFTFDAEYIAALNREKNVTDNKEYKESAWFGALACQVTEQLKIAARYEAFDDDMSGGQDGHLENRCSIGASYTLFEKGDCSTTVMFEYRRSSYEKVAGSISEDEANELFARVAFAF